MQTALTSVFLFDLATALASIGPDAEEAVMFHSHVIEVAGIFAGAAVSACGATSERFRFVAVDPRVEDLDGSKWPTLPDLKRVVSYLLTTGRLPPEPSGATAAQASLS